MRELESLDAWAKASEVDRRRVAETLASALGDEYRASTRLCGRAKLAAVLHAPTSTELVIVPGGTFVMGLRADEVARMVGRKWREGADTVRWIETAASANPPRESTVRPFLCACAPVLAKQAELLVGEAPWPVGADDSDAAAVRFGRAHAAKVLDAGEKVAVVGSTRGRARTRSSHNALNHAILFRASCRTLWHARRG